MSDSGEGIIRPSLPYGGEGGDPFLDEPPKGSRISGFLVRHGDYVDGIRLSWETPEGKSVDGPYHGGQGGTEDSFTLDPGETIRKIGIRSGDLVDSLTFETSLGRTFGPYGGTGGNSFEESFEPGPDPLSDSPQAQIMSPKLIGIFGRSGDLLDSIGFQIEIDFTS